MKSSSFHPRYITRLVFSATILFAAFASAQSPPARVSYNIALTNPDKHIVDVQVTLPPGPAMRELQLPVWNALYQVRDFSQYVDWIHAKDRAGKPLAVREINDSRWQIEGASGGAIVNYELYADASSPFGAQLNAHHAFFNLAEILMYPLDGRNSAQAVHFSGVPASWKIATPLKSSGDEKNEKDGKDEFVAENYDRLVDSPVEIGTFQESDFDESGGHFRVIVDADPADYDMAKIVADLHKITAVAISWMNDRPFDSYMFLYHFPRGPAGGGMEHAYSTAIDLNAETLTHSLYPLTAVTAHEFFHLWNVKRIRPQTLEPVDYTKENFTRALWFSEGVTSTVEEWIQLRAGLLEEKQFLGNMSDEITDLEERPARLTQSAEESSLDAWLEGFNSYRRPERSISYYNKGELLGFMLDLAIRQQTHDKACLRDVLQWMNANFAKKGRFFDDSNGVREAAEAVTHADFSSFFAKYVAGTEEIPWDDFLRYVGLHVEASTNTVTDPGFMSSRNFDGPVTVVAVEPGGEAERAGLRAGDALTEVQGKTAAEETRQQLMQLKPGDTLTVKVRGRRGAERESKWQVGSRQDISYVVKDLDQVTDQQRAHRAAWLKGEAEAASSAESGASGPKPTGLTIATESALTPSGVTKK